MMNSLLLLFCGLLIGPLAAQSTLHVISTIHPHEGEIAEGCRKDRENVDKLFAFVQQSFQEQGVAMAVRTYTPDFSAGAVYELLEQLPIEADDAVVFLYSGHGLEDPEARRWPLLYYCPETDGEADHLNCGYSLDDIHQQLRTSGARMSLAIGSSCNAEQETEPSAQIERHADDFLDELNRENEQQQYSLGLFTDYRGHIMASSAKPGQLAYLNDRIGSYYVDALVNTVVRGLRAERPVSWASILRHTDKTVQTKWKKPQEAQFLICVDDVPRYSDTEQTYAGDDQRLLTIEEDDYSEEWEEALEQEEALELLPYLLISELWENSSDEDTFLDQLPYVQAFYGDLLAAHYPYEPDEDYLNYALVDLIDDEEWFEEELLNLEDLYPSLSDEIQQSIEDFLSTMGQ
ncbi:hypothetical protein LEM8419_00421 [Neolewinella maritima]|uniref:Peptidase C14 caspase domain-containing protein n=1 Tax=Neolewinella maritima TaxID=1383882 RepID=A0ABN8F026_9BACT|nr:caspase family protein [Neolewinella maritima]CAH0999125.1 hypothetical protein LEM8419_00421 [Neolewinella maritima]